MDGRLSILNIIANSSAVLIVVCAVPIIFGRKVVRTSSGFIIYESHVVFPKKSLVSRDMIHNVVVAVIIGSLWSSLGGARTPSTTTNIG